MLSKLVLRVVALATVSAMIGCADDGNAAPTGAVDLAEKLPHAPTPGVKVIDVDAARAALRLPTDADPLLGERGGDARRRRLFALALAGLPLLQDFESPARALDFGQVSAGASTPNPANWDSAMVVATRQDAEAVRAGLKRVGYREESNGAYVIPRGFRTGDRAAAVGDGVVAFAHRAATARAMLARERASANQRAWIAALARVTGPVRGAGPLRYDSIIDGPRCVRDVAVADHGRLDASGELSVRVKGRATRRRLHVRGHDADWPYRARRTVVAAALLRVRLVLDRRRIGDASPVHAIGSGVSESSVYDCRPRRRNADR